MACFRFSCVDLFECLNELRQHKKYNFLETSVGNVISFKKRIMTNYRSLHFCLLDRPVLKKTLSYFLIFAGHREHRKKYTGNIHGMFVAGVVTKRKGFSSVLTLSKKKQININIHLDPQRAGLMVNPS